MTTTTHRIRIYLPTGSGRRVGWIKAVTAVDTSKNNGYAFDGSFLRDGYADVPEGGILVEQFPTGSVKHAGKGGVAYRVEGGEMIEFARVDDWFGPDFFAFRDAVANAISAPVAPRDEAISQIRALMAEHGITAAELA